MCGAIAHVTARTLEELLMSEFHDGAVEIGKCLRGIIEFCQEYQGEINVLGEMFLDGSIVNQVIEPLVRVGWYPNFQSPTSVIVVDEKIDEKMREHFYRDWDELLSSLFTNYAHRAKFIDRAAERHSSGDYISSVPLFITQIDGICHEHFGASYFSNFWTMKNEIDNTEQKQDIIRQAMFEALRQKPKMLTTNSNEIAPKRDGIMHGIAQFLDYDDEISSLKAFSLLAFVDTCINHG